jgi:hypothetical protein
MQISAAVWTIDQVLLPAGALPAGPAMRKPPPPRKMTGR